jgi:SAM-dependent methyltransferase
MDLDSLLRHWQDQHEAPVEGWDLSELDGRRRTEEPPWSYDALAVSALSGARDVLDLGTGGGEVLLRLADRLPGGLPPGTVATEGWPPNLPLARQALGGVGVPVVDYDAAHEPALPFPDHHFDVVLSRHEAYDAGEVFRVLRPGGRFLTQQVDGRDAEQLHALFGSTGGYPDVTLDRFGPEARAAGFEVLAAQEWCGEVAFADVAALVRYLAHAPWEAPEDFTVPAYADRLVALHLAARVDPRRLVFDSRRFYLALRRPA